MPEKEGVENGKHFSEIDMFGSMSCRHVFRKHTSFVHTTNSFQPIHICCNIMINPRRLYHCDCEPGREKMLPPLEVNFCSMRYLNSVSMTGEIAVIEEREKVV